jgi:serine/threonine-protein kinase
MHLAQLGTGDHLAHYRIDELVGRGGTGEVYRAFDLRLERWVAVKVLAPAVAADDRSRESFLRESRLAASLDHPNVLPIYEAGDADGRLYIAMRYVDAPDLRGLLRQSAPLDAERTLELLGPVGSALDAAHARGLVHRDVKPGNVLIASEQGSEAIEHVYLSDFGLAALATESSESGLFTGTAEYAAPELLTRGSVSGRTDEYALACVLFECLTGEPTFVGESVMAVLWGHVNDPVPSARARNPVLPARLDHVFEKALAKDPAKRYSSCRMLLDATREVLGLSGPQVRTNRRRAAFHALVALSGVAAAAASLAWLARDESAGSPPAGRGAIVAIDPAGAKVSTHSSVAGRLSAIAATEDAVWAADAGASAVRRIDADTGDVMTSSAHGVPTDIDAAGPRVVAANGEDGTVALFDAASGHFDAVVQLGAFGYGGATIVSDGRWAWVANGRLVTRVNLLTESVDDRVLLPATRHDEAHEDMSATGVALGEGALWVTGDALDPTLWRVEPEALRVTATIPLPFIPGAVAEGEGVVWVANQLDDSVTRVDASSGRVGPTIPVGREPIAIATGEGAVWVANALDGTVSQLDPRTNRVVATRRVGETVEDVTVGGGTVWVATQR